MPYFLVKIQRCPQLRRTENVKECIGYMLEKRTPKSFIGPCKPASHELLCRCFF